MAGFADGIKSGFGLVNDAYDRRSKDNYREESLKLEGEALADQRVNTKFTQGLATAKNEREEEASAQEILDRQQANKVSQNKIKNDALTRQSQAQALEAAQTQANNQATDRQTALDKATRRQQDIDFGVNATWLATADPQTNEDYEKVAKVTREIMEHPSIGSWVTGSFDPLEEQSDAALLHAMKAMEAGQQINDEVWVAGVQRMVGQSAALQKGTIITEETHPKAPERYHGMRIVRSEVHTLKVGDKNGAEDNARVKADVAVTVEDGKGVKYSYMADMTKKRSGTGEPVDLSVKGLFQAFAMKQNFTNYLKPNMPVLMEALKRARFADDNGNIDNDKFVEAKQARSAAIIQDIKDRDMTEDSIAPGSAITWAQFLKTPGFTKHVEKNLLIPGTEPDSDRTATLYNINRLRDSDELKKIDRLRKERNDPPLTDSEVLYATSFFIDTDSGVKMDGSKDWYKWRDKMSYNPKNRGIGLSFRQVAQAVKDNNSE